ncbi:MAG TPA: hypothetical protein PLT51_04335, partial [Candidatus Dojkabacteria bacterium]|nr:hypothetical protein [Candidatus Dojkabacteria bacterium]
RAVVKMRLAEIDATVSLGVFMQLEQAYINEVTQAMQSIIPKEDNRKTEVEPDEKGASTEEQPYARESMNKMTVVKEDEKEGEVNELNATTSTEN